MKKYLLYFIILIPVAILTYKVESSELFLLGLILVLLVFIITTGLINLFKNINRKFYQYALIAIGICVFGVVVSLFRPYQNPVLETGNISKDLQYAYNTDQNDRKQLKSFIGYFSKLKERDSIRLNLVKEFYEQDEIVKPIDKFYAAFIYHHSSGSTEYEIASQLASDAAKEKSLKDHYQVQWLRKAAYDRWMLSIGKPEKYNTQNSFSIDVE